MLRDKFKLILYFHNVIDDIRKKSENKLLLTTIPYKTSFSCLNIDFINSEFAALINNKKKK